MTEEITKKLLAEAGTISKVLLDTIKDVIKNYQAFGDSQAKRDTIDFYEELLTTFIGKDVKQIGEFPPTLRAYLTKANSSIIALRELLANATTKGVIDKLKAGGEFKNKVDFNLKQLEESYKSFLDEAKNPTEVTPWQKLFPINRSAGLFWLSNFHSELRIPADKFYKEMLHKLGGNEEKCCDYPGLFLRGYIIDTLCDEKESPSVVTLDAFKSWLDNSPKDLKDLYTEKLTKLATEDTTEGSEADEKYARRLYREAKQTFVKSTIGAEPNITLLLESKKLFEEYKKLVRAGVPLVKPPEEDRHLFYLKEIEAVEFKGAKIASMSPLAGEWHKWVSKYKTKTPKQKANGYARDHYAVGEAHYLQALQLMGEQKEAVKEETPPDYFGKPLNQWLHTDILDWLKRNKLEALIPTFTQDLIDGDVLSQLTDKELEDDLQIKSKVQRIKLNRLIKEWRPSVSKQENKTIVTETNVDVVINRAKEAFEEYKKLLAENKSVEKVYGDLSDHYLENLKRLEWKRQFGTSSNVPSATTTTTTTTLTTTLTTTTTTK